MAAPARDPNFLDGVLDGALKTGLGVDARPHEGKCREVQAVVGGTPYFCNRDVVPGSEFCHWHSPNKTAKTDYARLQQEVEGELWPPAGFKEDEPFS